MATFAEDIRTVTLPSVVGTFWGGSPAGLLAFHEEYTHALENLTKVGSINADQLLLKALFYRAPQLTRFIECPGMHYAMESLC